MIRTELTKKAVELLCDGVKAIDVRIELGIIGSYELDKLLDDARWRCSLPYYKKNYPAHKEAILRNIDRWIQYEIDKEELTQKFSESIEKTEEW